MLVDGFPEKEGRQKKHVQRKAVAGGGLNKVAKR